MRAEYVVDELTARAMARAVYRYRMRQPLFLAIVGLELVFAVAFAATGRYGWAVLFVLLALSLPLLGALQVSRAAGMLRARGFRPGTSIAAEWDDDGFLVMTPEAHSRHRYTEVRDARAMPEAVVIRLRSARILLVLPAALVPPEARARLAAARAH